MTNIDLNRLVQQLMASLVARSYPFDHCCPPHVNIRARFREVVITGVWGYQLYTVLHLIGTTLGAAVYNQVRSHIVATFNQAQGTGDMLSALLDLIETGISGTTEVYRGNPSEGDAGLELNIALHLLLYCSDSPHFVRDGDTTTQRLSGITDDIHLRLAECLRYGREEALKVYAPMLGARA